MKIENVFWKFDFFQKFWKFSKFEKFQFFFWIFHEKTQYSKAATAINLKDIRILKIPRVHRIRERISFSKNVWRARTSWRAQVEYYTIEVRARKNSKSSIFSFYGRIFYLRAPRSARVPNIFSKWYSLFNFIYPRYFKNHYLSLSLQIPSFRFFFGFFHEKPQCSKAFTSMHLKDIKI